MTERELHTQSDIVLGPFLTDVGFLRKEPGEYVRRTESGIDRILLSKGPPSRARTHFAVFMSYYPDYLEAIFELVAHKGGARGFPCGPYLNPLGAGPRPKYWSYKNAEVLAASLQHVLHCLKTAGIAWLQSLRDPTVFAASVDPMAALPAAMAHEVIGNHVAARRFYGEMMRRYLLIIEKYGEALCMKEHGRAFVFTAIKLDAERERRERFQRTLDFYPSAAALPPAL